MIINPTPKKAGKQARIVIIKLLVLITKSIITVAKIPEININKSGIGLRNPRTIMDFLAFAGTKQPPFTLYHTPFYFFPPFEEPAFASFSLSSIRSFATLRALI